MFSWCFDFGKYNEKYDWRSCLKLHALNRFSKIKGKEYAISEFHEVPVSSSLPRRRS